MYEMLREGMIARGSDPVSAANQAYAALWGILQGQASMLSFIHLFQLMAIIFLAMIPLLLLMKRPKRGGPVVAAH
jgi:DHA2 family multidrug resistance protein